MLIFEKFDVVLKAIDIVATYCALGYQPLLSFQAAPLLKSAKCLSPPFLYNPLYILVFHL